MQKTDRQTDRQTMISPICFHTLCKENIQIKYSITCLIVKNVLAIPIRKRHQHLNVENT